MTAPKTAITEPKPKTKSATKPKSKTKAATKPKNLKKKLDTVAEPKTSLIGPPADLWNDGREQYDWFTPPDEEEYVNVKERHPEKTRWSPQSGKVLHELLTLYEHHYEMTPWDAGWRHEFSPNNHRFFPPQSVLDANPWIQTKFKMKAQGLTSPQVSELLMRIT